MLNKGLPADSLDNSQCLAVSGKPVSRKKRGLFVTSSVAAIAWSVLQLGAPGGADAQAVGDPIVNPVTNDTETVTDVVENGVITDSGVFILTTTAPGQFLPDPEGGDDVEIQTALVNSTTGLVDRVQLVDGRTFDVVQVLAPTITPTAPAFRPKPTPFDINFVAQIFEGDRGGNGRSGGAFVSARGGKAGEEGPTLPGFSGVLYDPPGVFPTIDLAGQIISTRSDGLAGVERSSVGGNGGHGGDATLSIVGGGKPGGRGGAGGNVWLTVQGGTINTTGSEAHGIVAQSRSGVGGQGGDSTLAISGAGDGGEGNDGGNVTLDVLSSTTSITTRGEGSAGVLAQSLGGGAGSGGSAYNLFAFAGRAKDGGDGGNVNLTFAGSVQTYGIGAPGVFAQSLGGTGGQAGDAGGLAAFGDDGSGGGNGGSVALDLLSTARVFTAGIGSTGVLAQSVGGGGGATGTSVGLGAFGASGGSGGDGGSVALTLQRGAQVETRGMASTAVLAQSVGGGGGTGRTTVGVVALGATGGGGGSAGYVTLDSHANIQTQGIFSLGIGAQSVGGGGGNAGTTVGVLSLGGDGGDASHGGDVHMRVGGVVETQGALSAGVFGQSIGGGGGNGGVTVAGGLYFGLALGGQGGAGGNGHLVSLDLLPRSVLAGGVEREATSVISTRGYFAPGIQLQSVGRGGGNGGMAVTGTVGLFGSAAVAIGGGGASAGDASLVRLRGDVDILTEGARSTGIMLQSIGGGGGSGGGAIAVSAAGGPGGAASVSVAVGGSGGGGGDSLGEYLDDDGNIIASGERRTAVYLDSGGLIRTRGAGSNGIFAQSLGGGGGSGGFAIAAPVAGSDGVAVAVGIGVGGSGSGGGNASGVDVTFDGSIRTEGFSSTGAFIQSVGGGGGNGDLAIVGSVAGAGSFSGAVGVGVGGAAGAGGDGNFVRANILGTVQTAGVGSHGVVVQSVGGGGGDGGFSIVGSITASGAGSAGVGIGVGGQGGGGGDGGAVETDLADIVTIGEGAHGAVIQSVGGGGGNGGFNVTAGIAAAQSGSGSISVGLGGSGGRGGDGGAVTSLFRGDFTGLGLRGGDYEGLGDVTGLLAQSIGGGGGKGGFNVSAGISASTGASGNINIGFGGSGGGGGNAGTVEFTLDADEDDRLLRVALTGETDPDRAGTAILAQSVGGGGGNGGFNVSAGIAVGANGAGNIGIGFGGAGGDGGDAGQVTLNANRDFVAGDGATVLTVGDRVDGIVAQSVGGGGGSGAFNVTAGIAVTYQVGVSGNLGIGVGGFGGEGGHGSAVIANLGGDVFTMGHEASGIVLSSAGGGGGSGGFNVTGGIAVTAEKGLAGNIGVGVGGFGGGGGRAGDVLGRVNSSIYTYGHESAGLLTQSLAGGGGNGGFNVTGGISLSGGASTGAGVLGVGVGGFGGDGGDSGAVDLIYEGDIATRGDASYGALVQSQAGGGGAGGFNVTGGIAVARGQAGALGFGLGGFGGGGGNASLVEAHLNGGITTIGDDAFGLVIQSVGGGGGAGGFNVTGGVNLSTGSNTAGINAGIGGFGGAGGNGGVVTASSTGVVFTNGVDADGVLAQSVGGAGGRGAFNITGGFGFTNTGRNIGVSLGLGGFGGDGGDASAVSLTRTGDTITNGAMSDGVVAQSIGGGGGSGAFNISGQVAFNTNLDGSTLGAAIGIGGFGGDGGSAGTVTLNIDGDVAATGSLPVRYIESASLADLADLFGAELGPSGEGDDIEWSSRVRVLEDGSHGVVAQSVGGGGGLGSFNVSGNISDGESARGLALGIGGFGGEGGDADLVRFNTGADQVSLGALGDSRSALLVQSVGGGGGAGGFNVSGQLSYSGNATLGMGGFGGDGGSAGDVFATANADLFARGNFARGVLAQSVGGGGGYGGFSVAAGISASTNSSDPTLTVSVGGNGGDGGRAERVVLEHLGAIFVDGLGAGGVLAQSVGGGGGDGNFSVGSNLSLGTTSGYVASIGVGGSAGGGSDSGDVEVRNNGLIAVNTTLDADSETGEITATATEFTDFNFGLRAQSIGGGGGSGAFNLTAMLANEGNPFAASVGGSGGGSGNAGDVSVTRGYTSGGEFSPGSIWLNGDYSVGLAAESIGGGGGTAGGAFLVTGRKGANSRTDFALAANILVGGNGGGAGAGGEVRVDHAGHILVSGHQTRGIVALSVGGGGGNANFALGAGRNPNASSVNITVGGAPASASSGGSVLVRHAGIISTDGDESEAVIAQSVGGGGGNIALSMTQVFSQSNALEATLGRAGGQGGDGGDVAATILESFEFDGTTVRSVLDTKGDNSIALFAQSVGGGGGTSSSSAIDITRTERSGDPKDEVVHQVGFSFGHDGADGGHGGNVFVNSAAQIGTTGLESHGIFAQSIGGGGGRGGGAIRPSINATTTVDLAFGGNGGTGAFGGAISVENTGLIETRGNNSRGIIAESVGGGGGTGGYVISPIVNIDNPILPAARNSNTFNFNYGGDGGDGGIGGRISILNSGNVITNGESADGVVARSIGGGGGSGGITGTLRLSTSGSTNIYGLNIGGSGGNGGHGGSIDVRNTGAVVARADFSRGILAHSVGGGGGSAGLVANLDLSNARRSSEYRNSVTINIGGAGGVGDSGGSVFVENGQFSQQDLRGLIQTAGDEGHGIYARSVGGGGGDGGSVFTIQGTNAEVGSSALPIDMELGVAIGGLGGTGGRGGDVTVNNKGLIFTEGARAYGILAESIGGGGGNGGFAFAGNISLNARSNAPAVALGGIGGDGGDAGLITIDNSGSIHTTGREAHGIVARAIGGGGGHSRLGVAATGEPVSLVLSNTLSAVLGGSLLSSGGDAPEVNLRNTGSITTEGVLARTTHIQSIAGGGGSISFDFSEVDWLAGTPIDNPSPAADSAPHFSGYLGGDTTVNQNAGNIRSSSTGTFVSRGDVGSASEASSIGGGGGLFNLFVDVVQDSSGPGGGVGDLSPEDLAIGISFGGKNGVNNSGGDLQIDQQALLYVEGDLSIAAIDQSIGGGGGGANIIVDVPSGLVFDRFSVGMGGEGGQNETGGDVFRTQASDLIALGTAARGALMQSIGGGGGYTRASFSGLGAEGVSAEFSLGALSGSTLDGGLVTAVFNENVIVSGVGSYAILLQSVGAGGGQVTHLGGDELQLFYGAEGSASGDGGDIDLDVEGALFVEGRAATAVLAQSIGGGGGSVATDSNGSSVSIDARSDGIGDGGSISINIGGTVQTLSESSIGLVAMSAGGGGLTLTTGATDDDDVEPSLFSASAGGSGSGGDVDIRLAGDLVTFGDRSHGMLAQSLGETGGAITSVFGGDVSISGDNAYGVILQSIGGGGGFASSQFAAEILEVSDATGGDGGRIAFTIDGNVAATGDNAFGIIAQSLGGGGGWADGAYVSGGDGAGGDITINVDGAVFAPGENSSAVFAQSRGVNGAGNILMEITGLVRGGSGSGVGVAFEGGSTNQLTSFGSVSSVSGLAITGTDGNDAVSNFGLVVGSLDLGSGDNSFDNVAGSTFVAMDTIDLRDPPSASLASAAAVRAVPTQTGFEFVSPIVSEVTDESGRVGPASRHETIEQQAAPVASLAASSGGSHYDGKRPVQNELAPAEQLPVSAAVENMGGQAAPVAALSASSGGSHYDGKRPVQNELALAEQLPVSAAVESMGGAVKLPVQDAILPSAVDPIPPGSGPSGKPGRVFVMDTLDEADEMAAGSPDQTRFVAAEGPVNAATFRNSGTFLMGLSASAYPIDLLNGDTFGNLDNQGDPTTNLYYGARVINTVELDGHFEQTADGHLVFDVAYGPYASDRVNVTGSAAVAGTGDITLTWLENDDPVTLFATGEGGIDNGLTIRDTMAVDYSIAADAAGVHLLIETDFGLPSLNRNGRALGGHMDSAVQAGGSAGMGRLLALLGNMQSDQLDVYEAIFAELNPEPHLAVMHGQLTAANNFADDLFNCGSPVSSGDDQCVWSRLEMTANRRDATVENLHTEAQSMRFTGGFERHVGDDWSVAAGVSYETTDPVRIDGHRARTESQGFSVGLGVERNPATGPYYGAAVSGGWSWHETERAVTVFTSGVGTSMPETGYARLGGHVGDSFRHGSFFARPQVSASLTALYHDGLIEEGLDGLGIEVRADKELIGAINPQLTVGHIFRETEDMVGVVSLTGGLRVSTQDRLELPMRFLGSNPLADPAMIGTSLDQLVYQIGADIEIAGNERVGLSIGYDAEFGAATHHHRAGIDFRVRF
ncbi:autotransporter outer membrane beta-barrel domain-containing protein [Maricaulis sp.]|uniref:autotransporter outer membrane beta-barrel domain-containing protein n=1 Tax=Maricaulis sp. TaxID=1486257 RepID=UPI002B274B1A|nr:autotransporter outer membrane beta-barrel domain-containing protein [Maricaulis sp.]